MFINAGGPNNTKYGIVYRKDNTGVRWLDVRSYGTTTCRREGTLRALQM